MSCTINLLNYRDSYLPGDTIEGNVVCVFHSREEIRGIRLKLRGREHTAWTKSESYYDSVSKTTKHRTVHLSGDNKFLDGQINLTGEGTVGPGRLEYPFSFLLPGGLPGSFDGSHGNIRYYVKANVDIPWAPDYEDERTFRVNSPIDLNEISGLILNPSEYQDEKNICCLCCASGPITMDIYLEREAYVLGETMNVKIDVTNMSNVSVESLYASLKLTIKEKVTTPQHESKQSTDLIANMRDSGVGAHGPRTYNFQLYIPNDIVLPNFNMSTLFEKWFTLEVTAELPGCHTNLDVETGITIGHVPHRAMRSLMRDNYPVSAPLAEPEATSLPPPYPQQGDAPPYPTEPSRAFPMPGRSAPEANAPPSEAAPSAPPKSGVVEGGDWGMIPPGQASFELGPTGQPPLEPPPPPYDESMKQQSFFPAK